MFSKIALALPVVLLVFVALVVWARRDDQYYLNITSRGRANDEK